MFDQLNDPDEERLAVLDNIIRQKERVVCRFYDKKVQKKTLELGDLVWKAILPIDTKSRILGK